ncbi:hypothetical protein LQR30_03785 [Chromobacterium piscinae]|uniref:hypothetical protein n=1 Tax=Chromobacterium piscinae TaxID=686831 RepID=UPI001E44878D|nr:hypothetical protein [Chromobacterium piscinae]MCD4503211.1 hypothetical protein [Chromobacterium piscinae]
MSILDGFHKQVCERESFVFFGDAGRRGSGVGALDDGRAMAWISRLRNNMFMTLYFVDLL